MTKILSVGEVLWDIFPDGERFGGAPANFACHAALCGADVDMLSAVGEDELGHLARRRLEEYGVKTGCLQTSSRPTGAVNVELDANGHPSYRIQEQVAWDEIRWKPELELLLEGCDLVCFGSLAQRSEKSRATIQRCLAVAQELETPRLVDINLRPPFFDTNLIRQCLQFASILKLSDEELPVVLAALNIDADVTSCSELECLQKLRELAALDVVVLTQGADGAALASRDRECEQPGVPAEVRDTVGAGDAFTAKFALGYVRNEEVGQVLRTACAYAAEVCAISGALPPPIP